MSQRLDEAFGRWRELLHEPQPTTRTWRALHRTARWVARTHPDVFIEQWAPYAARLLERWPPLLRAWTRDVALELAASDAPQDRALLRLGSGACLRTVREVRRWHELTGGLPIVELSPPEDHLEPDTLASLLPMLRGTAALRLRDQTPLSAASVAALASWSGLPALRVLDLRGNTNGLQALEALTRQTASPLSLEVLRLGPYHHSATTPWREAHGDGVAAAITGAGQRLAALRLLDLAYCGLTDDALGALCQAQLPALRDLRLGEQQGIDWNQLTGLSDAAMVQLSRAPHLRGLEALNLSYNQITDAGLAEWGASANARALRSLSLSGRYDGDMIVAGLRRASALARLEVLRMNYPASLSFQGFMGIATAPFAHTLRALELRGDLTSLDMLTALEDPHALPALKALHIHGRHLQAQQRQAVLRRLAALRPALTVHIHR